MKVIEAIGGIIAIAIKCSVLFSFYYAVIAIKDFIKTQKNKYILLENSWRKKYILIHTLLAVMFFLTFLFSIMNIDWGIIISLIVIVALYILRIRNNLLRIK